MSDDDEDRQRKTWRRLRDDQEGSAAFKEALRAVGFAYLYPDDEKTLDDGLRALRERMELAGFRIVRKGH